MESPEELSVQEGYAAWAIHYDFDGNPLIPLEGPAVLKRLGPVQGKLVLDLGCGTGRHAIALANLGAKVWALDGSEAMLRQAVAKPGANAISWAKHLFPAPLPFLDQSFDAVVLGLVAEHLQDLSAALGKVARVLRADGRCVLSSLHPDRLLEGQRARFIDPETGLRQPIATVPRSVADYLQAGASAGLTLEVEQSLIVEPSLAAQYPRASRYLGQPLGWVACWTKSA
jgi:SAM-dependent methyltransferase